MVYVCIRGVMDVVFSDCIVTRGAVGALSWDAAFGALPWVVQCGLF